MPVASVGYQLPRPRTVAGSPAAPANLVPAFVNTVPVRALVDTGSSCSILAARVGRRALKVAKGKLSQTQTRYDNF